MAPATLANPVVFKWDKELYLQVVEQGHFDGRHIELIEGDIIEMPPTGNAHDVAISLTAETLRIAFPRTENVISIQMGFDAVGNSVPQPDLAIVRGRPRDFLNGKPQTAELIIEVSESSLGYDRAVKAPLYARSGVSEYWIINLIADVLEVFRSPVASSGSIEYSERLVLSPRDSITPHGAPTVPIAVVDLLP